MKYTVKKGDTLSEIAKAHNTTVAALVAANGIVDQNVIHVGEVLTIPDQQPTNNQLYNAFITCLDAIEALPEFQELRKMLYG